MYCVDLKAVGAGGLAITYLFKASKKLTRKSTH